MDPVSIASAIVKLAQEIYRLVNLAESNQKKLKTLAKTIEQTITSIHGLGGLPEHQQFIDTLKSLEHCLQETTVFILTLTKASWSSRLANAGKNERQLDEFKSRIIELYPQLTLGLSAQLLIDKERDRRDEEDDRQFFIQQQERILRAIQSTRLNPHDLEIILHKQLAAFEERLEVQLRPSIVVQSASLLPERFLVNLSDLTFDQRLGENEYGVIYSGTWRSQPVTIKSIDHLRTEEERQQFIREAQVMSHLRNEFIVPFYGACFENTRLCLLMGVMEKGPLTNVLTSLNFSERLQIAKDLALGLAYLHDQNIIHGDIKPHSVGINQHNRAKWMNFGLVKTRHSSIASIGAMSNEAAWQAPESWQRRAKLSQASDIYSFGMLLWTLMSARLPYNHLSSSEIMASVKSGFRETIPVDLPLECATLLSACWSADPINRPRAIDIANQLQLLSAPIMQRSSSPTGEEWYQRGVAAQESSHMKEAYQCYESSVQKNFTKAYIRMGLFKLQGLGEQRTNKKQAIEYLENAAHEGYDVAMYNLGRIYEKGDTETGVIDYPAALYWYKKALSVDSTDVNYQDKVKKLDEILSPPSLGYKFSKK